MKTLILTVVAGLALITHTQAADPTGNVRIGTYDSRSVVIAYMNTPQLKAEMKPLMDAHAKAKLAGDKAKMKELEAQGQANQARLHRQGFSTAPVDDILAKLTNEVAQVKTQANVSVLVSKWDKVTLDKYANAEKVDVTMQLIDALKPNERQRKFAIEIQQKDPIPLDKIDKVMESEGRH